MTAMPKRLFAVGDVLVLDKAVDNRATKMLEYNPLVFIMEL